MSKQQEPVAWMYEWDGKRHLTFTDQRFVEQAHPHFNKSTPLYTTPPQRKPLLASDIVTMYDENPRSDSEMIAFARAIEAAHGIKGEQ